MKKIFTFCFFAFALFIGTQSATAQNKAEINEKAFVKAKELRTMFKFSDNTLEQVYNAYQAYESKLYSINEHYRDQTTEYNTAVLNLEEQLHSNIKVALGDDLYKRYLIVENNKKEKQRHRK